MLKVAPPEYVHAYLKSHYAVTKSYLPFNTHSIHNLIKDLDLIKRPELSPNRQVTHRLYSNINFYENSSKTIAALYEEDSNGFYRITMGVDNPQDVSLIVSSLIKNNFISDPETKKARQEAKKKANFELIAKKGIKVGTIFKQGNYTYEVKRISLLGRIRTVNMSNNHILDWSPRSIPKSSIINP